jgi:DNA-binding GntR family transcriptional regulator
VGAAAGLEVHAFDLQHAHPALAARRLHAHAAHQARVGIEFLFADPAVTHRVRQDTVDSHRRLLEIIRSGDAKKATEEGRRHVASWIKLMPQVPVGG